MASNWDDEWGQWYYSRSSRYPPSEAVEREKYREMLDARDATINAQAARIEALEERMDILDEALGPVDLDELIEAHQKEVEGEKE